LSLGLAFRIAVSLNAIVGAIAMSPGATLKTGPNLAPKISGCQRMTAKASEGTGLEYGRFLGFVNPSANGGEGRYGARGRIRTADTAIFSRMLYQLSYPGIARRGS
jgi:hypothetical protein